jgi:hypothetical protein
MPRFSRAVVVARPGPLHFLHGMIGVIASDRFETHLPLEPLEIRRRKAFAPASSGRSTVWCFDRRGPAFCRITSSVVPVLKRRIIFRSRCDS